MFDYRLEDDTWDYERRYEEPRNEDQDYEDEIEVSRAENVEKGEDYYFYVISND